MRIVSINVGEPVDVQDRGRTVTTGIFKRPASGPVTVGVENLAGDRQADLSCHGGPFKAVYAYPCEHYAAWESELNRKDLQAGQFGENLTIEGLSEEACCLGDRWRVGTAVFEVAQPRMPCFKLGIRMNDPTFPKRFMQSGRTGVYLSIIATGEIQPGDAIKVIERNNEAISIRTVWQMTLTRQGDPDLAKRLAFRESLGMEWREPMRQIA